MTGILATLIGQVFSGGSPPVTSDPYYEYTTLLLPGNGTNGAQNNTFLDGSTNNFTITRNGNTTQGTFSPFSQTGWGNYFDGNGDSASFPVNSAFTLGTNDFTIEAWIYPNGLADNNTAFVLDSSVYPRIMWWYISGAFHVNASTTASGWQIDHTPAVAVNQWNHLVFQRNGNDFRTFLNGTVVATTTLSLTFPSQRSVGYVGRGDGATQFWNGYVSNFRVVNGTAVYSTSGFTPPTSPLTAVTNTSLLTCQSNRFRDASSNSFTITPAGNASVVAFSPFNPSASWSAATYGGSGYFDGSGDYLQISPGSSFAFGTGDFTVEGWVYLTAASSGSVLSPTSNGSYWDLRITSNYGVNYQDQSGITNKIVSANNVLTPNAWNHIALVRYSGTSNIYVNGASVGSAADSVNYSGSVNYTIAKNPDNPAYVIQGYMSGVRVVKGTAVYTGAFTPPTAPLTAITNTQFLANFTNAGIYDATSKNDLETVGNAQISTAISAKWGSGSMYFDGTGDYLACSSGSANPLFNMGTGDYTVEFWMYSGTPSSQQVIFDMRNSDTSGQGIAINYTTSRTLTLYMLGVRITSSAISANTWTHVAIARASGTYTMYVGGSSAGTWANSDTVAPPANRPYVGSDAVGSQNFNGYMQDLRITKGYARYTTNFTPPTAAFPTL